MISIRKSLCDVFDLYKKNSVDYNYDSRSILRTHAKYTTMYIMFRHEEDHVLRENASSVAQLETRS